MSWRLLVLAALICMSGTLVACTGNSGSANLVPQSRPSLDVGGSGRPGAITRNLQDAGGGPVNQVDDVGGGGPVNHSYAGARTGSAQ